MAISSPAVSMTSGSNSGMELARNGDRVGSTEHVYLDSIVYATHLLPVFKNVAVIPWEINFTDTIS